MIVDPFPRVLDGEPWWERSVETLDAWECLDPRLPGANIRKFWQNLPTFRRQAKGKDARQQEEIRKR
jgi:hypothetical protein